MKERGCIVDNPFMKALQWDIFCKVIDNFGDIGVCWRLAADLARRGHSVRLWVDDSSALSWLAPLPCPGVQVLPWADASTHASAVLAQQPCDVLVEAFGCEVAIEFIANCARIHCETGLKPIWINLEYLSAEASAVRNHGLPSPVQIGPAAGWMKWFFFPGFTAASGGLLREPDLQARQAAFDKTAWLTAQGLIRPQAPIDEKRIALFCYEPPLLTAMLATWAREGLGGAPAQLLVAAGRATAAVKAVLAQQAPSSELLDPKSPLSITYLPLLPQTSFDELLSACDLNFVRGEDSLVRALWAGKPFVWQLYPQDDLAHLDKLRAFLDWLKAPPSLRVFHAAWNGAETTESAPAALQAHLRDWLSCALAARAELLRQTDLSQRLLEFVGKNR